MKYKDISDMFTRRVLQIKMALRVRLCRPYIRKAINEWMETHEEPNMEVEIAPAKAHGKRIVLSAQSLIHDYRMSPLDALLFIDWANRTDKDVQDALNALVHRSNYNPTRITETMWQHIDPEVLAEYRKIEGQKEQRLLELWDKYKEIENCEIDEQECE